MLIFNTLTQLLAKDKSEFLPAPSSRPAPSLDLMWVRMLVRASIIGRVADAADCPHDYGYQFFDTHHTPEAPVNVARYANSLRTRQLTSANFNATLSLSPQNVGHTTVWLIACIDIPQGTEIFCYYGPDYILPDLTPPQALSPRHSRHHHALRHNPPRTHLLTRLRSPSRLSASDTDGNPRPSPSPLCTPLHRALLPVLNPPLISQTFGLLTTMMSYPRHFSMSKHARTHRPTPRKQIV